HDVENCKNRAVQPEPYQCQQGEVAPGLDELVRRFADDDHRMGSTLRGYDLDCSSGKFWADQRCEPSWHRGRAVRLRLRRHHGEVAEAVYEHNAHVTEMF